MSRSNTPPVRPVTAFAALLVAAAFFAGGCATLAERSAKNLPPPRIDDSRPVYVSVESPIMHPWIWSDEISESFYNGIVKGFREGGYEGGMIYLQRGREAPAGGQSIHVHILRWRAGRDDPVENMISVGYNAGDGVERDLGIVTGRAMYFVTPQDRLALDRAFDDSAQDAARQLLRRLSPGS